MQKLLFCILLTSLVYIGHSQNEKFKLGLHISPSLVNTHGNNVIKDYKKARIDFAAGVDIEVPMGSRMTLKSGLEYAGKGEKIAFPATNENATPIGTAEINVFYDYLQIPFLASYKISQGRTSIFADLGSYIGYQLSAKTVYEPLGAYEGDEINHTSDHRAFEFGIMAGLGLNFPISTKMEGIIAIHDHLGLTSIAKPEIANVSIKTHTIGMRMGAMLKL